MIGTYNILAGNSTLMGGHKEKLQQISAQGSSLLAFAKLMEKMMESVSASCAQASRYIAVCRSKEATGKCAALDWWHSEVRNN